MVAGAMNSSRVRYQKWRSSWFGSGRGRDEQCSRTRLEVQQLLSTSKYYNFFIVCRNRAYDMSLESSWNKLSNAAWITSKWWVELKLWPFEVVPCVKSLQNCSKMNPGFTPMAIYGLARPSCLPEPSFGRRINTFDLQNGRDKGNEPKCNQKDQKTKLNAREREEEIRSEKGVK